MSRIIGVIFFAVLIIVVYLGVSQGLSHLNLKKFIPIISIPKAPSAATFTVSSSTKPLAPPPPKVTAPAVPQPVIAETPKITPPAGFALQDLSPYYGKVKINYVNAASYYGAASQISIRGDYSLKSGTVDVNNWHVKTNEGDIFVPQAAADYNPWGLSSQSDVRINANDNIVLLSTVSPVGVNFRLNKCSGYLNNHYDFIPQLDNNCPSVNRNAISGFSGACQSYILSLGSCKEPAPNDVNLYANPNDYGCQNFLSQLNYSGCYQGHRGDNDFFSHDWWIWLGSKLPLDASHDRVWLLDQNGLLVDQYIY